jgi:sugar (pentulose or hexulose) kinase
MEYAIAVIDIGMTNKKVAVYDSGLRQLEARYRSFPPLMARGESGGAEFEAHDLDAMEAWFAEELRGLAAKYPIKALAVSTHGATFVCVGKDGKAALPCVYYTYEPASAGGAADFHERFYARFGTAQELQARTGTPAFKAMINPAKGIFFAQEQFPEGFKKVAAILPYPQYWGCRLTGKAGTECTYMGCHTYLWDQIDGRLSQVAQGLGIAPLLPGAPGKPQDVLGQVSAEAAAKTGLGRDTIVTMGIHDSNASLLPHFAKKGAARTDFVLNSTGTWCVVMNPVEQYGFAPDELGKVVFFNISAFGTPVKTAIFLGGQEFETWSKLLMAAHGRKDFPGYAEDRYRALLEEAGCFLLPELVPGSGQFPHSRARVVENGREWFFEDIAQAVQSGGGELPPCFKNYEKGFAVLITGLVMQTLVALERAGVQPGAEVFTEGGFRKNEAYNRLLASALPDNRVFLTDIPEATALGAAMTAKMALTGNGLAELADDFEVEYQPVSKADFPGLAGYRAAWMKLAG